MRRREFMRLLGGAAAAWPLAARTQQAERVRRIGVITGAPMSQFNQDLHAAFFQGLQQLGWTEGRNIHIDVRWGAGDAAETRRHAAELVALAPDVIFTSGSTAVGPTLEATRTVPIVFAIVPDPVGSGYVKSLSRPGGNATGFMMFEYSLCGKWPALLKEIAPHMTRAAVLRDPAVAAGIGQFAIIQSVAGSIGMDVIPVDLSNAAEIERELVALAQSGNGGLIVTASALAVVHRDLIVTLAAHHKVPAVYYARQTPEAGGLISYGPNFLDQFRRAAGYVDRILKGEKLADLPVQAPTKYELVINLKTARSLEIDVPQTLIARADEVIE